MNLFKILVFAILFSSTLAVIPYNNDLGDDDPWCLCLMNLSYLHQIVKAVWERKENLLTGAYIFYLYFYNL